MLFIILPTAFKIQLQTNCCKLFEEKASKMLVFVFDSTLVDDISENTAVHKKTESHENRFDG